MHEDVEFLERQILLGQVMGEAAHDETRRPLQISPGCQAIVFGPTAAQRAAWSATLDKITSRKPAIVVAGHMTPEPVVHQTIIMLLYDTAFKFFRFGDASVMAVFVFVTLMVVTLLQWRIFRKPVKY